MVAIFPKKKRKFERCITLEKPPRLSVHCNIKV
jgi:hypothetical protein